MPWREWVRTVEIEPSLYAADFGHLADQIDQLLRAGARIFHFDVGDGHFVEPITMGPIVLQSISEQIHDGGGVIDCHLMVTNPSKHFAAIAKAGGDSVTFHYEAVRTFAGASRPRASTSSRSASRSSLGRRSRRRARSPRASTSCSA